MEILTWDIGGSIYLPAGGGTQAVLLGWGHANVSSGSKNISCGFGLQLFSSLSSDMQLLHALSALTDSIPELDVGIKVRRVAQVETGMVALASFFTNRDVAMQLIGICADELACA
eukprot:CAMPEP_0198128828 /NCGR_PEP_ID=MMETSP1442-20131203/50296_1 /TAXON_ID= /ORGANISM="Craspedostauros australis, Strain CCMP3328" /LENGTH=114 /DNA_ID=CAMNT_0043789075 /DNA_START=132 /DNA_END=472 /DNA_ORIENTATION=+